MGQVSSDLGFLSCPSPNFSRRLKQQPVVRPFHKFLEKSVDQRGVSLMVFQKGRHCSLAICRRITQADGATCKFIR